MADERFAVAGPSGLGLLIARLKDENEALRAVIAALEARVAALEAKVARH